MYHRAVLAIVTVLDLTPQVLILSSNRKFVSFGHLPPYHTHALYLWQPQISSPFPMSLVLLYPSVRQWTWAYFPSWLLQMAAAMKRGANTFSS